jgi:uncharacterized membrane protein SpoIIM required for sporulation
MFYRMYNELWWVIGAVILLAVIFIRIGLRQFRREELLSREVEELRFDRMGSYFWHCFTGDARTPLAWYRRAVGPAFRRTLPAIPWTAAAFVIGAVIGVVLAERFAFPVAMLQTRDYKQEFLKSLEALGFFTPGGTWMIFSHNVQAILIAFVLGVISLGIMGLVILMLPIGVISFATVTMARSGTSAWLFLLGFVVPHGIVEIPAMLISGAAILRVGNCLLAKPDGRSLGQIWLKALADWLIVLLGVVLPMLLVASILETWVTPLAAAGVLGW